MNDTRSHTDESASAIVATCDDEVPALEAIRQQAICNGVDDLELLGAQEVAKLEPHVRGVAALWSPGTGVLDSHGFMSALKRDLEAHGGGVVFECPVVSGRVRSQGIELHFEKHPSVLCDVVINAAGLFASQVAGSIAGLSADKVPTTHYAKGHYFTLQGASPFTHLVYPVPVPHGLGTHVTLDLAGRARFGPDVWVEAVDYGFDEERAASFYPSIRRYYPALEQGSLVPGYTGIEAETRPRGQSGRRLRAAGTGRAWSPRTGESVRHRVTRTHRFARACPGRDGAGVIRRGKRRFVFPR